MFLFGRLGNVRRLLLKVLQTTGMPSGAEGLQWQRDSRHISVAAFCLTNWNCVLHKVSTAQKHTERFHASV